MSFRSYTGKIDGWTSESELRYLYCQAILTQGVVEGEVLEVGTWLGLSTSALAQADKLVAIDTFKGSNEPAHHKILADKPERWIYDTFISNMKMAGVLDNIEVLEGTSDDCLSLLVAHNRKFRLIFVDGSHEYVDVKKDFQLCKQLLVPNGVLVMDDYNWPGIKQAADEELKNVMNVDGKFAIYINR